MGFRPAAKDDSGGIEDHFAVGPLVGGAHASQARSFDDGMAHLDSASHNVGLPPCPFQVGTDTGGASSKVASYHMAAPTRSSAGTISHPAKTSPRMIRFEGSMELRPASLP